MKNAVSPKVERYAVINLLGKLIVFYSVLNNGNVTVEVVHHCLFSLVDSPLIFPWHKGRPFSSEIKTLDFRITNKYNKQVPGPEAISIKDILEGREWKADDCYGFKPEEKALLVNFIVDHITNICRKNTEQFFIRLKNVPYCRIL